MWTFTWTFSGSKGLDKFITRDSLPSILIFVLCIQIYFKVFPRSSWKDHTNVNKGKLILKNDVISYLIPFHRNIISHFINSDFPLPLPAPPFLHIFIFFRLSLYLSQTFLAVPNLSPFPIIFTLFKFPRFSSFPYFHL